MAKDAADRIIFVLLGVLVLFGVLSFFVAPAYEKGAWAVLGAAIAGLTGIFGFKFGVTNPAPKDQAPEKVEETT